VQETAVAGSSVDGVPYLMAVWQIQDPPGTEEIESPVKLHYAIGSFHPTTGALSWTEIDDVPQPEDHVTLDPAVAGLLGYNILGPASGGFVGAGVAVNASDIPSAFIALTDLGDTEFVPFENGFHFDCCESCSEDAIVRNTRLGSGVRNSQQTQVPVSCLLARSVDELEECAERHQIMARVSEDDWASASEWEPLVFEFEPIKGFPSSPRLGGQGLPSLLMFSYMDIDASNLSVVVGSSVHFQTGSVEDVGPNADPVLAVGGSDTYFTVAEPLLAGDFQIGPFTSLAVNDDASCIYVVYHDLVSAPSGGKAQFRVYLVRGDWDEQNEEYDWTSRIAIDADVTHEGADQFMPVVAFSKDNEVERVHVAWYDTRNDLEDDGEDVLISLYYAYSDDNGDTFTSIELDDQAISTEHLSNPKFIGDYISITPSLVDDRLVIVYMGTSHPTEQEPEESFGGPGLSQSNEAIYSWEIVQ